MRLYLLIILPLVLSNILHMLIVKRELFSLLNRPLSVALFGQNKTWRGFVVVMLLNGLLFWLLSMIYHYFSGLRAVETGAILGFVYMLSELPNSWMKRRLGIAPGKKPQRKAWLFALLDKTDSSLGVSLVSALLFRFDLIEFLQLFTLAVLTHIIFSWLMVFIGVKERF